MASIRSRRDNGMLFLDFRVQGIRCREQTALPDTTLNRRRLQTILVRIEKAIQNGTFSYREFFPMSKNAEKFDHLKPAASVKPLQTGIPTPPTGIRYTALQ